MTAFSVSKFSVAGSTPPSPSALSRPSSSQSYFSSTNMPQFQPNNDLLQEELYTKLSALANSGAHSAPSVFESALTADTICSTPESASTANTSTATPMGDSRVTPSSSCSSLSETPPISLKQLLKERAAHRARLQNVDEIMDDNFEEQSSDEEANNGDIPFDGGTIILSDASDDESEVLCVESSDEDDELWDDDMDDDIEDDDIEDGASFVAFTNSVHFDATPQLFVFDTPEPEEDEDVPMTLHERFLLAQAAKESRTTENGQDIEDDNEFIEHEADHLELDKSLLIAYINGLRNVPASEYKPVLQSRTLNTRPADIDINTIDSKESVHRYLDRVLSYLLGFFEHMVSEEQWDQILALAKDSITFYPNDDFAYEPRSIEFQGFLSEILGKQLEGEPDSVGPDVLNWVAGEVIEPLGRLACRREQDERENYERRMCEMEVFEDSDLD